VRRDWEQRGKQAARQVASTPSRSLENYYICMQPVVSRCAAISTRYACSLTAISLKTHPQQGGAGAGPNMAPPVPSTDPGLYRHLSTGQQRRVRPSARPPTGRSLGRLPALARARTLSHPDSSAWQLASGVVRQARWRTRHAASRRRRRPAAHRQRDVLVRRTRAPQRRAGDVPRRRVRAPLIRTSSLHPWHVSG
jgi:hypothetical protein